jgi:hypothetical protein
VPEALSTLKVVGAALVPPTRTHSFWSMSDDDVLSVEASK